MPTKVCLVKAMFFQFFMYGYESWTIKKAELQRINVFKLWFWGRLLEDLWTTRKWNQSILKEISPEYSLEEFMLKLNLQYFDHLMQKVDSLEKTLILGKTEGREEGDNREWDDWVASLTQWTWVWANSKRQWRTGKSDMLQSMGLWRIGQGWVIEHHQQHELVRPEET